MKPILFCTLLAGAVLAACSGGGVGGNGGSAAAAAAAAAVAPGNSPSPSGSPPPAGTPATVMNLHAEFSVEQPYVVHDVTGTGTTQGESKITVKGVLDRRVTVQETAQGHINFHSVAGHPAKLTAVVEHTGSCLKDSPNDSIVRHVEGKFSFSGPVTESQLSYTLKASRQGAGDELSFRIYIANLTGSETVTYTRSNGITVAMPNGCVPIVLTPAAHQINPSPTTRQFSDSWVVFPAISGPAPTEPTDAMLRKLIEEHPDMHFTGLTTSATRREWRYKGTRYLVPRKPGRPDWPQHLDVVWRLEPI